MATREELADDLARDVMAAMVKLGDLELWERVAKVIGTYSPSSQEAFVTAMRIRLADQRGRTYLGQVMARAENPDLPVPELPRVQMPSADGH